MTKEPQLFEFNPDTDTSTAFVDGQLTFYGGTRAEADVFFTRLNRLHDVRPAPNAAAYTMEVDQCRKQ